MVSVNIQSPWTGCIIVGWLQGLPSIKEFYNKQNSLKFLLVCLILSILGVRKTETILHIVVRIPQLTNLSVVLCYWGTVFLRIESSDGWSFLWCYSLSSDSCSSLQHYTIAFGQGTGDETSYNDYNYLVLLTYILGDPITFVLTTNYSRPVCHFS